MTTIITGLFHSQSQSGKISHDLESAGFRDSDYIMYLHDKTISRDVKTSLWQYFFKERRELEDDSLVISVRVKNQESIDKVTKIFNDNFVLHQNLINNIRFEDAKSLEYLKRVVSLRAKASIFSVPEIRFRKGSKGISSDVAFG